MPVPAGGPTLPAWAPTLAQVAAYVPRRTLTGSTTGFGTANEMFTPDTRPTADAADMVLTDACNWVLVATGALDVTLEGAAQSCAAVRAAGFISLTWPDLVDELEDARRLLDEAEKMRADLAAANIAVTADDPATGEDNVLPEFVFPAASPTGDLLFWAP